MTYRVNDETAIRSPNAPTGRQVAGRQGRCRQEHGRPSQYRTALV